MVDQQIEKDKRLIGETFRKIFLVDEWITKGADNMLIEWQGQEENKDKSIPILLFYLLSKQCRNWFRELYLNRYHNNGILPEWDCVPVYQELELFIKEEDWFFDDRFDISLSEWFDPDWHDVVDDDYCYCDFEMCPVTQLLTMDD
jgi:hypothetical protein